MNRTPYPGSLIGCTAVTSGWEATLHVVHATRLGLPASCTTPRRRHEKQSSNTRITERKVSRTTGIEPDRHGADHHARYSWRWRAIIQSAVRGLVLQRPRLLLPPLLVDNRCGHKRDFVDRRDGLVAHGTPVFAGCPHGNTSAARTDRTKRKTNKKRMGLVNRLKMLACKLPGTRHHQATSRPKRKTVHTATAPSPSNGKRTHRETGVRMLASGERCAHRPLPLSTPHTLGSPPPPPWPAAVLSAGRDGPARHAIRVVAAAWRPPPPPPLAATRAAGTTR